MSSLRIIFAGTPDFAARHLEHLIKDTQHEIVAVYTMPDRPAGRGKRLTPSPVKVLASENNIPVYQPSTFRDAEAQQQLAAQCRSHGGCRLRSYFTSGCFRHAALGVCQCPWLTVAKMARRSADSARCLRR